MGQGRARRQVRAVGAEVRGQIKADRESNVAGELDKVWSEALKVED